MYNKLKVLDTYSLVHSFKYIFLNGLKFIKNYKIRRIIKYDVKLIKNYF